MPKIRVALLACAIASVATFGGGPAGALAVDECDLLTKKQATVFMGTKPIGNGTPDNEGCSWSTDPLDRANLAYVTLTVEPLSDVLGEHPDLRTAIDESTNVGIEPLEGVGKEAYLTYSPLTGPGFVDGVQVLVGKQVLQVGFQPLERVANPSEQLDDIVAVVKKMVKKVRNSS